MMADKRLAGPKDSFRILVVEDDVINQKVIKAFLLKMGLEADLAHDGREALNKVLSSTYDIIFMDVQMPIMDGIEATRSIRKLDLSVQPYIIALTANAFHSNRKACLQAGMNDFLSKPFSMDDLRGAISCLGAQQLAYSAG